MFVDGYVIDGHVPVATIRKLLAEKPAISGITLPGMPLGSPGMGGEDQHLRDLQRNQGRQASGCLQHRVMTAMATDQTSKGQAPGIESGPFDVSRRRVLPMLPLLVLGGLPPRFCGESR